MNANHFNYLERVVISVLKNRNYRDNKKNGETIRNSKSFQEEYTNNLYYPQMNRADGCSECQDCGYSPCSV